MKWIASEWNVKQKAQSSICMCGLWCQQIKPEPHSDVVFGLPKFTIFRIHFGNIEIKLKLETNKIHTILTDLYLVI